MPPLNALAGRIAAAALSLLVIVIVLILFIGVAMDRQPLGPSSATATPRPNALRTIVVSVDTIPTLLVSGSVLLMLVTAPEVLRRRR